MGNTTGNGPRRSRLATVASLIGGALTLRLRTYAIADDSMRPTLHDDDWVVTVRRPRSIRPGDVVILEYPTRPELELVKRVSSIGGDGIVVLGDDPGAGSVDSVTFGPVTPDSITGRVVLRHRPLPPALVR